MRTAVIILSVIVTAYAEAPYHLPRPPPHLPSFNYQPSSPPAPAPPPPPPPPVFAPAPLPPVFAPAPPPPSPVYAPAPPPPPPVFAPAPPPPVFAPAPPVFAPAPQSPPVFAQAQVSQSYPQIFAPAPPAVPRPLPQYITQQATSQYQGYSYPQPNNGPSFAQAPQQTYIAQPQVQSQQPIFAPAQPQPSYQPQQGYQNQQQTQQQYQYLTGPQAQAISQPQSIPQQHQQPAPQPSYSYGTPQIQYSPIRPLPAIVSPQPVQAPIQYYQQQQSQGASYQQSGQQVQSTQQVPVQNQNYNSDISSYQADSHQYNSAEQAQTHRDALDSVVVNRVQNIIKDNEHSSAKERGYLSLVSGVSLENAKPSLEILSFEHRSPLTGPSGGDSGSQVTSSGSSSYSASSSSISSDADSGFGFLPQTKPATSYGVPN